MHSGIICIEEFTSRLEECCRAHQGDASSDSIALSERALIDFVNKKAEELAQELKLWIPFSEVSKLGVPSPSGVENDVYYDAKTDCMVKVNNLMTSKDVLSLFHRFLLHSSIFPQTGYQLIGFTGFGNGSIFPIVSQAYVPDATYATHGEILDYMEALGFHQIAEASFSNDFLIISDLRPRNVLKSVSGTLYVVDADFVLRK